MEFSLGFERFGLDSRILDGVAAEEWSEPTPIQDQAIPAVLEQRDVLGLAQTGTGKTGAFMLPILQRLTSGPLGVVRALVLAPTRELAEQIRQATDALAAKTRVRTVAVYGGVPKRPQSDALRHGAEVVVACPGRLLDHMGDRAIDLSRIEVLVLDEADRMCDMGFLPDIQRILRALPRERQTLFFSATMPDDIRRLADRILRDPVKVQIGHMAPAATVAHALYPVTPAHKARLLVRLLEQLQGNRVLVFTRTKYRAARLAKDLGKRGFKVGELQGDLPQRKRQQAMDGFREGRFHILVATDIAARGIDVADISHVINFDMPDNVDQYTHRIGRTGRALQSGEAFTLITHVDEPMVNEIEMTLGELLERRMVAGFDYGHFGTTQETPAKPPASSPPARSPAALVPAATTALVATPTEPRSSRKPKWRKRAPRP